MTYILLVEDTQIVGDAVRDTLGLDGWQEEMCADSLAALAKIESKTRYDLLLLDNELPWFEINPHLEHLKSLLTLNPPPVIALEKPRYNFLQVRVNCFYSSL